LYFTVTLVNLNRFLFFVSFYSPTNVACDRSKIADITFIAFARYLVKLEKQHFDAVINVVTKTTN